MQLIATDDMDEFHGKTQTDIGPDGETVILALDGIVRELHLTAGHAAELRGEMRPWLDAGHDPGQPPLPPGETPLKPLAGRGGRREVTGTREFYLKLREWAAECGIEIRTAGRQGKKTYVYDKPPSLRADYVAHLLKVASRGGPEGDAARAALGMARVLRFPFPEQPGAADG
jgi:hypothetical protein